MNEQVKKYPKVIHNVLIDLPDKNELKQIAGNFPVFLSSRFTDMEDIREGVAKKFIEYGYPVLGWELGESFGGSQKLPPRNVYLESLQHAKIYCGILDTSYGSPIIGEISATEDEYSHAYDLQLEMCLLVSETQPKDMGTEKLAKTWKTRHTVDFYDDLSKALESVELFIKNHLIRAIPNWIMLGDVILPLPYTYSFGRYFINFTTTNGKVADYFEKLQQGEMLNFTDLSKGCTQRVSITHQKIEKRGAGLWDITLNFSIISLPRMEWSVWSKGLDVAIVDGDIVFENGLKHVSGIERIPQVLKINLNVQKGSWVLGPDLGSYLHHILNDYEKYPIIQELLIKFDVIETLTGFKKKNYPEREESTFPCLEKIEFLKINIDQDKKSALLDMNLFMKELDEPILQSTEISHQS